MIAGVDIDRLEEIRTQLIEIGRFLAGQHGTRYNKDGNN
jgi:hypothetical protein